MWGHKLVKYLSRGFQILSSLDGYIITPKKKDHGICVFIFKLKEFKTE